MKLKHLSSYLFLTLIISFAPPVQLTAEEDHTPLGEAMEEIGGAWRRVKRQAADPSKNSATLAMVARMQAAAAEALQLEPALLEDIPDAEKEAFKKSYMRSMKGFAEKLDELAAALKAGDNAAAAELVQAIDNSRKKGHEKYKKPDEE